MTVGTELLAIENLKVHFPVTKGLLRKVVGHVRAVDGVSISIRQGETLGLVGESGCGKTTLARAVIRLVPPTEGSIFFHRQQGKDAPRQRVNLLELAGSDLKAVRRDISAIFQDPFSSLNPRMTVGDIIGEPMKIHGIPKSERIPKAIELLSTVGLNPSSVRRYPNEFSGGQRQRISIARAISLHPDLILCDEPTSALDVSVQAQVLNLMADLQTEFNLTYLFVSHNLSVVEYIGHRIAVMYLGKIVEVSEPKALYAKPLHPYTEALLSAIPFPDPELRRKRIRLPGNVPSPMNPPSGCYFHPRCKYCQDVCKQEGPELRELQPDRWVACHRAAELSLMGVPIDRLTRDSGMLVTES